MDRTALSFNVCLLVCVAILGAWIIDFGNSGYSAWELRKVTPSGYHFIDVWGERYACNSGAKCLNDNLPEEKACRAALQRLETYFPSEHYECIKRGS